MALSIAASTIPPTVQDSFNIEHIDIFITNECIQTRCWPLPLSRILETKTMKVKPQAKKILDEAIINLIHAQTDLDDKLLLLMKNAVLQNRHVLGYKRGNSIICLPNDEDAARYYIQCTKSGKDVDLIVQYPHEVSQTMLLLKNMEAKIINSVAGRYFNAQ